MFLCCFAGPRTDSDFAREHARRGQQSRRLQHGLPLQGKLYMQNYVHGIDVLNHNSITVHCMLAHQVSDATGSMTTTKVSDKSPFAQELLIRDDCFILDNGSNGKVFVWKGEELLLKLEAANSPPPHIWYLMIKIVMNTVKNNENKDLLTCDWCKGFLKSYSGV